MQLTSVMHAFIMPVPSDFKKCGISYQMEEGVQTKEDEVSEQFKVLRNEELTVCV
jgi:hypothetical protein